MLYLVHSSVWKDYTYKVVTLDNLLKKGAQVNDGRCLMCEIEAQIVCHLFFTCRNVSRIWKMCDLWIGV